jgi:Winged helix DNA-binding domain
MNVAQSRLRNQFIVGSPLDDPAEVVRSLCAVQAQDYYAALWAVGLRLRNAVDADIERAITDRRIVRTWPMRGTLHFVAAEDARWLIELLGPRTLRRSAARLQRDFDIDASQIKQARKIVERSLRGGVALTRPQLYERLDAAGITTSEQRGMHILWWLAHEGLICCGARSGKQHTFVLLDEWIPGSSSPAREDALAALAERYFAHHGPATLADFIWWAGITASDGKTAIETANSRLEREHHDGKDWWFGPTQRTRAKTRCVLLPVYDEYTVGYSDRSAVLDPAYANHESAGHGIFRAPIVVDGKIIGSWSRELKKDEVQVSVTALNRFTREHSQLITQAAARYGEFLGLHCKVVSLKP